MTQSGPYPPIEDYGLISDCHCTALVSKAGSIDWCCMPRMDSDPCFGRLLDWERGGYCAIQPVGDSFESDRHYDDDTLVLVTHFRTEQGEVTIRDFFAISDEQNTPSLFQLVRIVDGIQGELELEIRISPRFDFGEIAPYIRCHEHGTYTAWASNGGMVIHFEEELELSDHRNLRGCFRVRAGERYYLSLHFDSPERLNEDISHHLNSPDDLDHQLKQTQAWWKNWIAQLRPECRSDPQTLRSVLALKGLIFERTGAMIAAPTTSLPEWIGTERNWDYRFSWIRDSVFAVGALHHLGFEREARRFARFIELSSAGSPDELQVMFGIDGKRRLPEITLDWLEGYRGSRPVRIGNRATNQLQLDIFPELMELTWIRHTQGEPIKPYYWQLLVELLNYMCTRCREPDHGLWEVRDGPRHFVFSKAMCWAALHRGLTMAAELGQEAPIRDWKREEKSLREEIETQGYDHKRGIYLQSYGEPYLDSALLLLPRFGYISYDDPKMVRTVAAIQEGLQEDGLLLRYNSPDGVEGEEGFFLPCTFWLVECLAEQGKLDQALSYYQRALDCANDLGLFSEEYDVRTRTMLGNFPQALTQVSQITAKVALDQCRQRLHESMKPAVHQALALVGFVNA